MATGQGYNPYRDGNGKFTSPDNVGEKVENDYEAAVASGDSGEIQAIENYAMEKMPESRLGRELLEAKYGTATQQRREAAAKAPSAENPSSKLLEEIGKQSNNPALKNYGFPEDELVRSQIHESIRQKKKQLDKSLEGTELEGHGEFVVNSTITHPQDHSEAIEERTLEVASSSMDDSESPRSWKALMGDRRKTAKAVGEYRNQIRATLSSEEDKKAIEEAARAKAKERAFGRTVDNSGQLPEPYKKALEKIWNGDGYGSKSHTEKAVARMKNLSKGLREGTIAPSKIVGSGYKDPKAEAKRYLQDNLKRLDDDLFTKGATNPENARKLWKQAEKEGWPLADGKVPAPVAPRRPTEREKVAQTYGHLSVDELHGIQRVHIDDYNGIKKELDAAGEEYRSGQTNSQEARKKVEDLARRKVAVLETINSFGHLIDSKDGTIRS